MKIKHSIKTIIGKLLTLVCLFSIVDNIAAKESFEIPKLKIVENKGQVNDFYDENGLPKKVLYYSKTLNSDIFLQKDRISFLIKGQSEQNSQVNYRRVDFKFLDVNLNAKILTEGKGIQSFDFYKESNRQIEDVSTFKKVTYKNIYDNIDVVFYSNGEDFKYDFVVHPGGDPRQINYKVLGNAETYIDNGNLIVKTSEGIITEKAPYSYQRNGKRVRNKYKLDNGKVSFNIKRYDKKQDLIIDPVSSTLLSGTSSCCANSNDSIYSIIGDRHGNTYALGKADFDVLKFRGSGWRWLTEVLPADIDYDIVVHYHYFDQSKCEAVLKSVVLGSNNYSDFAGNLDLIEYEDETKMNTLLVAFSSNKAYDVSNSNTNIHPSTLSSGSVGVVYALKAYNQYQSPANFHTAAGDKIWSSFYQYNGESTFFKDVKHSIEGGTEFVYATGYIDLPSGEGIERKTLLTKFSIDGEFDVPNGSWETVVDNGTNPNNGYLNHSMGQSMVLNSLGDIFIAGRSRHQYFSSLTISQANELGYGFDNQSNIASVVFKFNNSGVLQNGFINSGEGKDVTTSLEIDELDNLYVVGYTNSGDFLTFPAPFLSYRGIALENNRDIFVYKIAPSENTDWPCEYSFRFGGDKDDYAFGTDIRNGEFLVAASSNSDRQTIFDFNNSGSSSLTGGSGEQYDALYLSFQDNGNLQFSSFVGNTGNETTQINDYGKDIIFRQSVLNDSPHNYTVVGESENLINNFPAGLTTNNPASTNPLKFNYINSNSNGSNPYFGAMDYFITCFSHYNICSEVLNNYRQENFDGNMELLSPGDMDKMEAKPINKFQALVNQLASTDDILEFQITPLSYTNGIAKPDWSSPLTIKLGVAYPALSEFPFSADISIQDLINSGSPNFPEIHSTTKFYWRFAIDYNYNGLGTFDEFSQTNLVSLLPVSPEIPSEQHLLSASHSNDINWTYAVNFLEEGKYTEEINYRDGLGFTRQVQVKTNTQNEILTKELVYSEEGSQKVESMLAPSESSEFNYASFFFDVIDPLTGNRTDFSTEHFDAETKLTANTSEQIISPSVVGTINNYYGSSNTDKYIDDAQGYPYISSVTLKEPEERLMFSSVGAGQIFNATDKNAKRTKHFYTQPSEKELIRVFGSSNTPDHNNVRTSIVYSPDNIGALTYTDNEGNVIATALTACNAESLTPLTINYEDGQDGFRQTIEPIANSVIDPTVLEKSASSQFFIDCQQREVDLVYDINLKDFISTSGDCEYCGIEVLVNITNDVTGEVVYTKVEPVSTEEVSNCVGQTIIPKNIINLKEADGTALTLTGPATYTITRVVRPLSDPEYGNQVERKVQEFIASTYNSDNEAVFRQIFEQQENTQKRYFILRKILTDYNYTHTFDPNQSCDDVVTLSGDGIAGNANNDRHEGPSGIAKNLSNLNTESIYYVCDNLDHTLTQVNAGGSVSILAGKSGVSGNINTSETINIGETRLTSPLDVVYSVYENSTYSITEHAIFDDYAVNSNGDKGVVKVWYKDPNHAIPNTPVLKTVFDISGTGDALDEPEGMYVDNNKIYIANTGADNIFELTALENPQGLPFTYELTNIFEGFNKPHDVIREENVLYVAEDNQIVMYDMLSQAITVIAGSSVSGYEDGNGLNARFHTPASIVKHDDIIYVSDKNNHVIRTVNVSNQNVETYVGGIQGYQDGLFPVAEFDAPWGLCSDVSSRIYLADFQSYTTRIIENKQCGAIWNNDYTLEELYYPDEIDLDIDEPASFYNNFVNLDAQQSPGIVGSEKYQYSTITPSSSGLLGQGDIEYDEFVAAYERVHNISPLQQITSLRRYDVTTFPGNTLTPTQIPLIDDQFNFVNVQGTSSLEMRNYFLLEVTMKGASCEQRCEIEEDLTSCEDQCNEEYRALHVKVFDAFEEIKTNYPGLKTQIDQNYPLTLAEIQLLGSIEEIEAYENYSELRQSLDNFDITLCINTCNGTNEIGACETCDPNFISCTNANIEHLSDVWGDLLIKWEDEYTPNSNDLFPYFTLDELKPINTTLSIREEDPEWLAFLGRELYDLILADIGVNNLFTAPTWADASLSGGSCSNCATPGTANCPSTYNPDLSLFPSSLFSLLEELNLSCVTEYSDCMSFMGGSPEDQNEYLCNLYKQACLESLDANIDPDPTDPTTFCDIDCEEPFDNLPNHMLISEITKLVHEVHGLDKSGAFYEEEINALVTEAEGMTYKEFLKLLAVYRFKASCVKECQEGYDARFRDWLDSYRDSAITLIRNEFIENCLTNLDESFDISYTTSYYHYTLYDYDKAGRLISTIPPEGIDYVDVKLASPGDPNHRMETTYEYHTNGVRKMNTPDGGETWFIYDKAGRVRFSQNDIQRTKPNMTFSYTNYDEETGAVVEGGEFEASNICQFFDPGCDPFGPLPCISCTQGDIVALEEYADVVYWPNVTTNKSETVHTVFSEITFTPPAYPHPVSEYEQEFLNRRVSKSYNEHAATYYSYDGHGRVKWTLQEIDIFETLCQPENKYKTINYEYHPLTGQISKFIFQKNFPKERLEHRFTYDADNRLSLVEISKDGNTWKEIVSYEYYKHGPLKNKRLGENVQDVDYVYNLNGWLKAINHPSEYIYANDMDEDGLGNNAQPDVFSEIINYYNGDFNRVNVGLDPNSEIAPTSGTHYQDQKKDLYSGNISSTMTHNNFSLAGLNTNEMLIQAYEYDYLNRIRGSFVETKAHGDFNFQSNGLTRTHDYEVSMDYDANGNILELTRNAYQLNGSNLMDDLTYGYELENVGTSQNVKYKKVNNRLYDYAEQISSPSFGSDLQNTGLTSIAQSGVDPSNANYAYDAKGRLVQDLQEGIENIDWTIGDKVKEITRSGSSNLDNLSFAYNATGERLYKKSYPAGSTGNDVYTIYVRDPYGQVLANYKVSSAGCMLEELPLYGSGRLGTYSSVQDLTAIEEPFDDHKIDFELTDHLGNVRAVVNGAKLLSNLTPDLLWNFNQDEDEVIQGGFNLINNSIQTVNGKNGSRAIETNNSQYIDIEDESRLDFGSQDFTIAVWANKYSQSTYGNMVVGKWNTGGAKGTNEWGLTSNSGANGVNPSVFLIESGNTIYKATSTTKLALEEWNFIVGKREGDYIYIYINGTLEGSTFVGNIAVNNVGRNMMLGRIASNHASFMYIDELSIFNRALSDGEVEELYHTSKNALEANVEVKQMTDYYPFGMPMPNRNVVGDYKYGFNGMEKDDEVKGSGNSYTTHYRLNDVRVGRWFSVDPVIQPWQSPYTSMDNNPINGTDPNGAAFWHSKAKRKAIEKRREFKKAGYSNVSVGGEINNDGYKQWHASATNIDDKGVSEIISSRNFREPVKAKAGLISVKERKSEVAINVSSSLGFLKVKDNGAVGFSLYGPKVDLYTLDIVNSRTDLMNPENNHNKYLDPRYLIFRDGVKGSYLGGKFESSVLDLGVMENFHYNLEYGRQGIRIVNNPTTDVSIGRPGLQLKTSFSDYTVGIDVGVQEDIAKSLNYHIFGISLKGNANVQYKTKLEFNFVKNWFEYE